jgi:aldehyde dehydrogenase (NAD+)
MIKPGAYSPVCSHTISRLVQKYLDPDCFRVAEGDRSVTSALLEQRFDKICFTGSGFVGKLVLAAAAKHLTPCMLELGGKSPAIVDRSADLDHAASRLAWGTFVNAGQTCVRPDFCLVHDDVADKFLHLLKTKLLSFYGRDAQQTEWFGRCINAAAAKRLAGLVEACKGNIYHGGRVDLADRFVEPTILDYGRDLRAFSASEAMQVRVAMTASPPLARLAHSPRASNA